MMKRVLNVGQCVPDHAAIARFLRQHFDCHVETAAHMQETMAKLEDGPFDLILVNRKLDIDYSDGMEVIRSLRSDARFAEIPVMLISNYPDYQEDAVALGAHRGFGKAELGDLAAITAVRTAFENGN